MPTFLRLMSTPALAAAILFAGASTQAATISIDHSSGLTLGLEANQVGNDVEIRLSYTAQAGWTNGPATALTQAGFKVAKDWDSADITLTAIEVNGSAYANAGDWSSATEASNSSTGTFCTTGTSSDKGCVYALNGNGSIDLSGGGEAVFSFHIAGATLIADTSGWHIGGQLCDTRADPSTCKGRIISESGPPVPEPTAALVFGLGLAVFAVARHRRN